MVESIKFGDVFRYKEKFFVFLAKTEEIIYTAQILDLESTRKINALYERITTSGKSEQRKRNPLYCYVLLSTVEFQHRMAHFKDTAKDESAVSFNKVGIILDRTDLIEIKNEIINPDSPIPLELKRLVSGLDISN